MRSLFGGCSTHLRGLSCATVCTGAPRRDASPPRAGPGRGFLVVTGSGLFTTAPEGTKFIRCAMPAANGVPGSGFPTAPSSQPSQGLAHSNNNLKTSISVRRCRPTPLFAHPDARRSGAACGPPRRTRSGSLSPPPAALPPRRRRRDPPQTTLQLPTSGSVARLKWFVMVSKVNDFYGPMFTDIDYSGGAPAGSSDGAPRPARARAVWGREQWPISPLPPSPACRHARGAAAGRFEPARSDRCGQRPCEDVCGGTLGIRAGAREWLRLCESCCTTARSLGARGRALSDKSVSRSWTYHKAFVGVPFLNPPRAHVQLWTVGASFILAVAAAAALAA